MAASRGDNIDGNKKKKKSKGRKNNGGQANQNGHGPAPAATHTASGSGSVSPTSAVVGTDTPPLDLLTGTGTPADSKQTGSTNPFGGLSGLSDNDPTVDLNPALPVATASAASTNDPFAGIPLPSVFGSSNSSLTLGAAAPGSRAVSVAVPPVTASAASISSSSANTQIAGESENEPPLLSRPAPAATVTASPSATNAEGRAQSRKPGITYVNHNAAAGSGGHGDVPYGHGHSHGGAPYGHGHSHGGAETDKNNADRPPLNAGANKKNVLINIEPEVKLQPSKSVYNFALGMGFFSLVTELLYAWFCRKYTAKGMVDTLSGLGIADIQLPENYGNTLVAAPVGVEFITDLLTLGDLVANIGGFAPFDEAKEMSEKVPEGFREAIGTYLIRVKNEFGTVGLASLAMTINFLAGAWADVEPLYDSLDKTLGVFKFGPIALLMSGGVSYYVFFSAQDVLNSVNFLLNKEPGRLSPPQEYLWQRVKNHGEIAVPIQVMIEGHSQNICRGFAFAFLLGRFAEQLGGGFALTLLAELLGYGSGFAVSLLTRYPKAFQKYYGNGENGNRLDLVTADERDDARTEEEQQQGFMRTALKEMQKFMCGGVDGLNSNSLVGYAQTGMATYFGYTGANTLLAGSLLFQGWPLLALSASMATGAGILSYIPYRRAQETLRLNKKALEDPAVFLRICNLIIDHTKPDIQRIRQNIAANQAERNRLIEEIDQSPQDKANSAKQKRIGLLAIELEKAFQQFKLLEKWLEYAENQVIELNKQQEVTVAVDNMAQQKPPKASGNKGSTLATLAGTTVSALSNTARALQGVSFFKNTLLKRFNLGDRNVAVFALGTNTITSENNHQYMRDKNIKTFNAYSSCCTDAKGEEAAPIKSPGKKGTGGFGTFDQPLTRSAASSTATAAAGTGNSDGQPTQSLRFNQSGSVV